MKSEDKEFIVFIGVIVIILAGGYAGLAAYTGFGSPFSVVMSESMQHDPNHSEIGCIDTGDVVIVRSPDKVGIQSYVEGTETGFRSFGDFGSVIIYERGGNQNPVIHRAIVWLEWSDGKWSAPSLKDYDGEWYYEIDGEKYTDYNNIRGNLHFIGITDSKKDVHINLDNMPKRSGYLTMGDNPITNRGFDQASGIINHLISTDEIRSIPVLEVPWLGTLKILLNENGKNLDHVPNSLPSLIMTFVVLISLLMIIDMRYIIKNKKELDSEIKNIRDNN